MARFTEEGMIVTGERPSCECHGLPMLWGKDAPYRAGGFYRCGEKHREQQRTRYADLDGRKYNNLLLRHRRTKALARRRHREEASG